MLLIIILNFETLPVDYPWLTLTKTPNPCQGLGFFEGQKILTSTPTLLTLTLVPLRVCKPLHITIGCWLSLVFSCCLSIIVVCCLLLCIIHCCWLFVIHCLVSLLSGIVSFHVVMWPLMWWQAFPLGRGNEVGGWWWWCCISWGVITEVRGAHSIKYKTTITTIIIVVIIPCPSSLSLVLCHWSASPVSVCGHWLSFVGCGGWWLWAMVCFVICGWSSLFVGSCLCFLAGCGCGAVIGGCWHSTWSVVSMYYKATPMGLRLSGHY